MCPALSANVVAMAGGAVRWWTEARQQALGWPGSKLGLGWLSAGGWHGLLTRCCGLAPGPSRWVILALSSTRPVSSGGGVGMRAENGRTSFQGLELGF